MPIKRTNSTLTEHKSIIWVKSQELDQLEWAPADIPTVKIIMDEAKYE